MPYNRGQNNAWNVDDIEYNYTSGYASQWQHRDVDIHESMTPLIERIQEYDMLRERLEQRGGRLLDLPRITSLLTDPVSVETRFETYKVALANQNTMQQALRDIHWDIRISIRQLPTQMPVYYICRIRRDYWAEYSLIVEDYYRSPGFDLVDGRFVKLMQGGHQNYFLRLADFREASSVLVVKDAGGDRKKTDRLLYDIGRHVLQAAWHDDQRLGKLTAEYLNLPKFFWSVELLYLHLGGELCDLRSALNNQVLEFFESVYPQPAIRYFLEILATLDGDMLNDLPVRAVNLYRRLSRAFSRYLSTEIRWGGRGAIMPLWKILYSNFGRLKSISGSIKNDHRLMAASIALEEAAVDVIVQALCGPVAGDKKFVAKVNQFFRSR